MLTYLLRYVRIWLQSLFRTRLEPTEIARVHFIAWPFDCEMKAMNAARIMMLMDNARFDFVCRMGLFKAMIKNGWLITLGAQRITYLKPIRIFSRFLIEARIVSWHDRWYICECKVIQRGQVMAIGYQRGVLGGRRGSAMAIDVFKAAGHENLVAPPVPDEIQEWLHLEDKIYRQAKATKLDSRGL